MAGILKNKFLYYRHEEVIRWKADDSHHFHDQAGYNILASAYCAKIYYILYYDKEYGGSTTRKSMTLREYHLLLALFDLKIFHFIWSFRKASFPSMAHRCRGEKSMRWMPSWWCENPYFIHRWAVRNNDFIDIGVLMMRRSCVITVKA